MAKPSSEGRRRAAAALVAVTAVLLLATSVVGYARLAVFDSDQFAARATATLRDPAVRTVVAERVTDKLVLPNQPDLLAARPIIVSAVSALVGGGAFASLFHHAALDAHRAVFAHDEDTITLALVDVGTVAAAAIEAVRPDLAGTLRRATRVVLLKQDVGAAVGDVARTAQRIRVLAWVLAALTLGAGAAALVLAPDRRHTAGRLGIGAAVAGVVLLAGYAVARQVVLGRVAEPDDRAAAAAVWSAFLGDLRTWGWVLAGTGAVVAAAAASLIRPVTVEGPLREAWRIATTRPQSVRLRVARAIALIALGVLVVAEPALAVRVAATAGGVYLLSKGLEEILRLIYRPTAEHARRPGRPRRAAVIGVAGVLVAGALAAFLAGGGAEAPAAAGTIDRCNGHAELCDRPFDRVVLPATHNSMAAPLPGWALAEQDRSIGGQLEDGVRGLLLDTHYGDKLDNGRVRTYFADAADLARATQQDSVSQEQADAVLRLRERLGFRGRGTRGTYLCHTFCEIGATPLADGLDDVHDFLATHPDEVVMIVNQDYVTPPDIVKAVHDARLTPYMATPPPAGGRWPTLREMIESGHRLVMLAENDAGAAPWYQLVYQRLTEETPYVFRTPALLTAPADRAASCASNRGPAGAPLFLINHWVLMDPIPLRRDATTVNAYAPLLARARECQALRHHLTNLLAVNFYKEGDVFRVVDTLNGVK